MAEILLTQLPVKIRNYARLKRAVLQVLVRGQREVEALKVRIYWQTGKLIRAYLDAHSDEDAKAILEKLSHDIRIEVSLFYRVLQFADRFSSVAPGRLTWTHYRELLTVDDNHKRRVLADEAKKGKWPVRYLRLRIQKESGPRIKAKAMTAASGRLEEPVRRRPGTRRVKKLKGLRGGARLVVDLGFDLYEKLKNPKGLKEGACVRFDESKKSWIGGGSDERLYYYTAEVERVVDGDTLLVHIDVGTHILRRQYLRFRAVDAQALSTPAGQKARDWLRSAVLQSSRLLIKTHLTDKYDRYIADIWSGHTYLNGGLLEAGLAKRAY